MLENAVPTVEGSWRESARAFAHVAYKRGCQLADILDPHVAPVPNDLMTPSGKHVMV